MKRKPNKYVIYKEISANEIDNIVPRQDTHKDRNTQRVRQEYTSKKSRNNRVKTWTHTHTKLMRLDRPPV